MNHPHILPLLDSGETAGLLYYVMPYVDGESLRDRLKREKQLPIEDAVTIAAEIADALTSAHQREVIHRDIKRENILFEGGHAVVADFGIARAIHATGGEQLTETGIAVGTPAYMSPEQAAGQRHLDGRSDLYSLGCVLHEMLGGEPPFTGATVESIIHQHMTVEAPPITNLRPTVPSTIATTVKRALAKSPADRLRSASVAVLRMAAGSDGWWVRQQFNTSSYLGNAEHLMGNYAAAKAAFERILPVAEAVALRGFGAALVALDEIDGLDSIARRAERAHPLLTWTMLAWEAHQHGYDNEAAALYDRAVAWSEADSSRLATTDHECETRHAISPHSYGAALYFAERIGDALPVLEACVESGPDFPARLGLLALAAAAANRPGQVAEIDARLTELEAEYRAKGWNPSDVVWQRMFIAAASGRIEGGMALLRADLADGGVYGIWLHRDPRFDPLRAHPDFSRIAKLPN